MPAALRALFASLASSATAQQLAPLAVLLLVPALAFALAHAARAPPRTLTMLLEHLGLSLAWGWAHDSAADRHHKKNKKKKHARARSEHAVLQNGSAVNGELPSKAADEEEEEEGYYPGLVNISGTYCFLNSVAQAMASLSYLHPHIDAIHARAEELDVPTPVIDALRDILQELNTPRPAPSALRPAALIAALARPTPGRQSRLFSSREHQDAQELFQLLSECLKAEALAVEREGLRDRGLGALGGAGAAEPAQAQGVFDGLTANRRSCVECGYTEAVMHFAFDNWQLAVPRLTGACTLQDCLADYIRLELLTDCICRKCSMLATHQRLVHEAERLSEAVAADPAPSQSKKKRAREARRLEARVKAALEEGRVEEDIKGVTMEKVFSKASTKQAMIARPPRVLALHLNRSVHYGNYAGRNSCRVVFPEVLDLTPYTTSGQLSTVPSVPISTPPPPIPRATTPTPATYATPRVLYRLAAVVCHYGQHSFGHYVCFRRKPPRPGEAGGPARPAPPPLACPAGCECTDCSHAGPVRDAVPAAPGRGWLRLSDDAVAECGFDRVRAEGVGAFMLFYERAAPPPPPPGARGPSPRSSQETVRPRPVAPVLMLGEPAPGARIVRSAAAGRERSTSAVPLERPPSAGVPVPESGATPAVDDSAPESLPEAAAANGASEQPEPDASPAPVDLNMNISHHAEERIEAPPPTNTPARPVPPLPRAESRTSSPSPSRKAAQARIKAPQPIRPHLAPTSAPVRLGLLA